MFYRNSLSLNESFHPYFSFSDQGQMFYYIWSYFGYKKTLIFFYFNYST